MRVSELYGQVAGLGFEKSLEDSDIFYQAANRALLQVNSIRPAVSAYAINHKPMKNLLSSDFLPIERYYDITFEAEAAKAYYFESDGVGVCYIEKLSASDSWDIIGDVPFSSGGGFVSYSGFIKDGGEFVRGRVRLRFSGDYLYSVRCVALYEHIRSDLAEDIPAFEPYSKYDISVLVSDFLTLEDEPLVADEEAIKVPSDYNIEGGRVILFPRSAPGCYKVLYRRRPREIENVGTPSDDEAVIDLDEELCALMALNMAAYIWADDEPEKAEYYLSLYRERAAEIQARDKKLKPARYVTNGW